MPLMRPQTQKAIDTPQGLSATQTDKDGRQRSSPEEKLRSIRKPSIFSRVLRDDNARLILLIAVLWAAIGYLDMMEFTLRRGYPVSVLYFLVIFPAAAVFGNIGLVVSTVAVVVMFHFTNDKQSLEYYTEAEVLRLGFVALVGFAFARIGHDRGQIKSALTRLQRETKVREDLTHMLVHDLRTPLTGIITSMQTLQLGVLGDLDADQQEMVDFAVTDGQRLLEMVNQILDVARLEAGEMPLRAEEIDLAELASNACRLVKPIADSSEIAVECDNPELKFRGDPELLRRVLQNLLGNAVKFTPRGGQIRVGVTRQDSEHAHVVVSDTGWGIPKADLARIFEKYAQSKGSGKSGPSTGIGLTFCRLAVEAHGGRIWAESEMGQGTQMHILLPLIPAAPASAPQNR